MDEIFAWVRDVFLIIISVSFFQTLIPESTMDKYIKFVFSVVILAIVTEPVIFLIKGQ